MLRKAMSALILLVFTAVPAIADTLLVEGLNPDLGGNQPQRGAKMETVAAEFGEPVAKSRPVGDPPISRWEYEPFFVYFEYGYVLHAVAKR